MEYQGSNMNTVFMVLVVYGLDSYHLVIISRDFFVCVCVCNFCSDLLDWLAFCKFQTFMVQSSEPVTSTGSVGWKATDVTASK